MKEEPNETFTKLTTLYKKDESFKVKINKLE